MLYILLAGGMFNAVLVPQLVRAMRRTPTAARPTPTGSSRSRRCSSAVVSVVLVVAAPWVMDSSCPRSTTGPSWPTQRDSIVAFARFCLPQVFFYGMFALVGQVLNARRRFGPMMWAPIANNLVAIAVLVGYLVYYGPVAEDELCLGVHRRPGGLARPGRHRRASPSSCSSCCPSSVRPACSYRPRFDFRGTGLGHTLRLGVWTVLFVVVNQIAYAVVVRLASGGTAQALGTGGAELQATGYTVYAQTFLIVMVPHAVITVSLATAMLPLLSSLRQRRRPPGTGREPGPGAAHGPGGRGALRGAAAGGRARPGRDPVGLGRRQQHLHALHPVAVAVRRRRRLLHRPLPGAARLLRPRAHPHRVLDPVRRRGDQHRGGRRAGGDHRRRAHRARSRRSPTPRRTSWARCCPTSCCAAPWPMAGRAGRWSAWAGWRRPSWSGSWCAWRSRPGSPPSRPGAWRCCCPAATTPATWWRLVRLVLVAGADVLVFVVLARLMRLAEVTEVIDTVTRRLRRRARARRWTTGGSQRPAVTNDLECATRLR